MLNEGAYLPSSVKAYVATVLLALSVHNKRTTIQTLEQVETIACSRPDLDDLTKWGTEIRVGSLRNGVRWEGIANLSRTDKVENKRKNGSRRNNSKRSGQ
jgi:hypothetical protein